MPTTADLTADRSADDDGLSDNGFASFEVGAGLPTAAGSRPFLRSVLADEPADEPGEEEDDAVRELPVRDRFARLDAGLPPLPGDDGPDEVLAPVRRRAALPKMPAKPDVPLVVRNGVSQTGAAASRRGETSFRTTIDAPTPEPPLFAPIVETPAEPEPAPEPARVAAAPAAPKRRGIFRAFSG